MATICGTLPLISMPASAPTPNSRRQTNVRLARPRR